MTSKERNLKFLRQYLKARSAFPWVAIYAEQAVINTLQRIGGIAGSWSTDYSECTYSQTQWVNGKRVDLSTVELLRAFYERSGVAA